MGKMMQSPIKLPPAVLPLLRCPLCKAPLQRLDERLRCTHAACGAVYPISSGVPILIHESASVFSIEDILHQRNTFFAPDGKRMFLERLRRLLPDIGRNVKAKQNCDKFANLLLGRPHTPIVLVLGGGGVGRGMDTLLSHPSIRFVESDVSFGPRIALICDAHNIPFDDGSFDGVIVQAVLEHVVDPYRCVDEIHRVLKQDGLVYAETPFMQQVHGGRYDFTRFTHLGHRRLFRKFEEIESGAVCGPGMALAWSYQYFLSSFAESKQSRSVLNGVARLTSFYLKYFDYVLIDKAGTLDAASGYYLIGRKSSRVLPDRELIKLYKGAL